MSVELKIPSLGESISEVQIAQWRKGENDAVAEGEEVVTIDSEKASVDLPAPAAGKLVRILKQNGEMARVGEAIALIENGTENKPEAAGNTQTPPPAKQKIAIAQKEHDSGDEPTPTVPGPAPPSPESSAESSPEDVGRRENGQVPGTAEHERGGSQVTSPPHNLASDGREEEVVPMSPLRRTVARRLVEAQHQAALLTTFNEADMSAVIGLRKEHGEAFQRKYGCRLGFMSFFVKASIDALKKVPQINAEVRGETVVFRNYFDIGVAISSGRGLVVPILRNAERLSFAEIELAIASLAERADAGKLGPADLAGGTFTISNGGVFGSLLSTPIVNPPQSGVLGMHAIQDRPVAVGGQVVIRPMMYLALTYDHRVVDGREAVTFLKRIKETIESPARMLIEA